MRLAAYLIMTLLFSTATAQNPTILQGNYISNVFGQSNFVKNPNAQTNETGVTKTTATATRSTTTPLVATTEWNVTITSANGTVAWDTRSFDEGMKNQNCEARFTYRGFQATSKAQIKQGANVVAELVLTPSATDPRIASINFPCGDLSSATTFVITDTATLAGTNEIGGIYVGLATNQANVAQAEFVGSLTWPNTGALDSRNSITWAAYQTLGAVDPTVVGSVTSPNRAPRITIPKLKAGNYKIIFTGNFLCNSSSSTDAICGHRITDGTTQFGSQVGTRSLGAISGNQGSSVNSIEFEFEYTGATISKTFQLETIVNNTSTFSRVENSPTIGALQISVYRFPSSSELVVTPETQNVWGAVRYSGSSTTINNFSGVAASTTYTTLNSSGFTSRRTLQGKCVAPISGDNVGCQIENMPVGNYKISVTSFDYVSPGGSSGRARCGMRLFESTTSTSVATSTLLRAHPSDAGVSHMSKSYSGVFNNSSVGTRNFILQHAKTEDTVAANASICGVRVDNLTDIADLTITIEPLDNNANSALYVQGPVKAAGTGTAIPEPYQGFLGGDVRSFTNGSTYSKRATYAPTTAAAYQSAVSMTLNPGLYWCSFNSSVRAGSATSWFSNVTIDGTNTTPLNNPGHATVISLAANFLSNKQLSLPFYLTTTATVSWDHRTNTANATEGYHEMWCMRVN